MHIFGNSCTRNLFDTSAIHTFNLHLEKCLEKYPQVFKLNDYILAKDY